jgi:transcriptional regulator GlxA family with amidase domain
MLVLYLRRTGNQSQFHGPPPARLAHRRSVRELQQYIAENPAADLSLATLADRLHVSPRHFARIFREEVGVSAGRYAERIRLQAARRLLEETTEGTEAVAAATGFGSYQSMRRAFVLAIGVSPAEYRRRFGATPAPNSAPALSVV